jgi:hypothetical protein
MSGPMDPRNAAQRLLAYCRENDWAGYDPYDALNSKLFEEIPFLNSRIPRLVLTQAFKRSPINLRTLFAVPKKQNPKALGLFLSALLNLARAELNFDRSLIQYMIQRLAALRSRGTQYSCWGYSFPWQTRTIVVPAGSPNLVCTVFAATALLDAYESGMGDSTCLEMASSAAAYIHDELFWQEGDALGFSYPLPTVRAQVHNANF